MTEQKIHLPEEPDSKKLSVLSQAFGSKAEWKSYDDTVQPVIDVDLSICLEKEKPRMIAVINRLAKSPAGRETLEIAAKGGFKFGFLDAGTQAFGVCFPTEKRIGLHPNASDDKLVGTLCHEARHAGQAVRDTQGDFARDVLDVKSILMSARAKEADAQLYAVMACEELRRGGDKGPAFSFAQYYPPITKAFYTSLAENHAEINPRVMTDTFAGWYDQTRTKVGYEENYLLRPMNATLHALDEQRGDDDMYHFKKSVSCEKVAELIGWTRNGNYFTESPKMLEEPKFLGVCERTMSDMQDFFIMRHDKTGIAPDPSIEQIPVYKNMFDRRTAKMGEKENANDAANSAATEKTLRIWHRREKDSAKKLAAALATTRSR